MKAETWFSKNDQELIEKALGEAEEKTSGEIVPAIAFCSGRYDRAEDIFGLLTALLTVFLAWTFFQGVSPARGAWAPGPVFTLGPVAILALIVIGFAVGSALATYFPVLRQPFILKREMAEEVERRAAESFYRYGIGRTKGGTGILIYVSLYERMVAVKGDRAISEKLTQEDWETICAAILKGLKAKNPAQGLQEGIRLCGTLLSAHFPRQANDVNELANTIRFIN